MIATERFNFIHFPKTGGSFTQKILLEAHARRRKSFIGRVKNKLRFIFCEKYWNPDIMLHTDSVWGQHGGVNQIPKRYRNNKTVSIIRNPFDWYASLYGFKYWEEKATLLRNLSFKELASYPSITIEEMYCIYQQVVVEYGKTVNIDLSEIGYYTWHFIIFYFRDSDEVLRRIVSGDISDKKDLRRYMHEVTFLKQENLNRDLYNFLVDQGYKDIEFILSHEKFLPQGKGRAKSSMAWKELITEDLKNDILKKDKIIFTLFPDYEALL